MTTNDISDDPAFDPKKMAKTDIRSGERTFTIMHQDYDDHIFKIIRNSGKFYEYELLDTLRRFVGPGDFVVDVGANIGNHTIFFAGVCGCRVLALEPHPLSFAILKENIRANDLQSLVVAQRVAAGREKSEASFEPSGGEHNLGGASLRTGGHEIDVAPLDVVLAGQRPRLLKIDVEGMELAVLHGARRTLRHGRPIVCVEAKEQAQFEAIFDYLAGFGLFVGSVHNFSPTHLFFHSRLFEWAPLLSVLSRFMGSFFIRSESTHSELRKRLANLEAEVALLSKTCEALAKHDDAGENGAGSAP